MPNKKQDKPEAGKIYSLTGAPGTNCIANGNTWADSEFKEITKTNPLNCVLFGADQMTKKEIQEAIAKQKEKMKANPLDSMTDKEIQEAMEVAGTGLSRDDFSDDGSDLDELNQITEGGI